jgi:glyoxylase-like metal-dependent hydrolase (beta-lactamase superfamily II)
MSEANTREVYPGIFVVHLPLPMKPTIINVYLVRGGGEWALVDTGMNTKDSIACFGEALETVGCRPGQIGKIIGTHHHPDHYGCSATYKKMTGAELYFHRAEYECARAFLPSERPQWVVDFFRAQGLPLERFANIPRQSDFWKGMYQPGEPDVWIEDGDVIEVGGRRIEVVWTPGHAPGHCVLYLPEERVMIVGDHLLPRITPHVGFGPGSEGNPLADFIASQEKVQRFEVDFVLPAHGGVFEDHRHRARQIIHHHEARLEQMLDLLRRGPHCGYEVARWAFDFDEDSPVSYQFPATFETLAHLEYLRQGGRAESEVGRDGILRYRAS